MSDHTIFNSFQSSSGVANDKFQSDYIGTRIDRSFDGAKYNPSAPIKMSTPQVDEEYFEWIDILEAAQDARGQFTVVELGAGYGRWAARACLAALQLGISNVRAVLVDAEPVHAEWAGQHMKNNGITEFKVFHAAIGPAPGKIQFIVEMPGQAGAATPDTWYGQAVNWTDESHHVATGRTYHGFDVIDNGTGWGAIEVDVLPLTKIIEGIEFVDIIDMDIQGAEADVVESSIGLLSERVKRLHIGTHSLDVETRIRLAMNSAGWRNVWDFPCGASVDTPYGTIAFQDGVQGWVNPNL